MTQEQNINLLLSDTKNERGQFDLSQNLINQGKQLNLRYGFKLGTMNLLIDKTMASEIIQNATIYPVPNTPDWILGLIHLHGILIPVFNIKKYFGQADEKEMKLLALDQDEDAFAIYIDTLPRSINLDKDSLIPTDIPNNIPGILNAFVNKAYILNEKEVWLNIDYNGFINNITRDFYDNL